MSTSHHITPLPIVTFGLLDDLIEEARHDHDAGKTVQAIRISTNYRTKTTSIGEERTLVFIVVTSLITESREQNTFAQYGFWSWLIDWYAEINGRTLSERTRLEASLFTENVVESLHRSIEQELGSVRIPVKKGMYTLDPHLTEVSGTTSLLDLAILRSLVHPPQGVQAHQVTLRSSESVVLGTIHEGTFHAFNEGQTTLAADERVQLLSPDHITSWLRYPSDLDIAIAAKTDDGNAPTYRMLYTPEQGWIGNAMEERNRW